MCFEVGGWQAGFQGQRLCQQTAGDRSAARLRGLGAASVPGSHTRPVLLGLPASLGADCLDTVGGTVAITPAPQAKPTPLKAPRMCPRGRYLKMALD